MEDAVNCARRMAKFGLSISMIEIAARNFFILSLLISTSFCKYWPRIGLLYVA